jgi:hypothetical protein
VALISCRSRIRTGYDPENISRLRRFAIDLLKSKPVRSVAQAMRQLFDYLVPEFWTSQDSVDTSASSSGSFEFLRTYAA